MRSSGPNETPALLSIIMAMMIVIPFVASASWWNPVSWFGGWFGLFDSYATVETVAPTSTTTEEEVVTDVSPSSGFFSRAKPAQSRPVSPEATTTPRTATATSSTKPSPSPISPNPSAPKPPAPKPGTPPPPPKVVPPTSGVVNFYGDARVAKRTSGTATSSNSMRIWFPATSTKMTIKQTAVSGISFKTGTCKVFPCTLTNVISVSSSVKEGTYPVKVTVTSGTSTAVGTFVVTVAPPEPLEIQVSVSGPITVKKNPAGSVSGSNIVNIQLIKGTPVKLTLSHAELPDGVTGKTIVGTCTPPCKVTNSLTVTNEAQTGRHPLVITATGEGITRSVAYDLNVAYASGFGMHFDGEKRTYTQNQNPTAVITMDYPFDLTLDGGTPETAYLGGAKQANASTSVTYSRSTCTLPCKGLVARIELLQGMKPGSHKVKLQAVVNREEQDRTGGTKIVTYTETFSIPIKIVPLALPF
jgi:hypothetical protein